MNDASLCVPCFTAAHRMSIHFLQEHCSKAHFRNILKCSNQTSVFQQVSLRSAETSSSHDKQKTDFEVFLTYVSSMSLFVFCFLFFEVESKREGTTVWLLHENLEKEHIPQRRHCSQAEWKMGALEPADSGSLPSYTVLYGDLENRHSLDPACVVLLAGERGMLTCPDYLLST